MKQVVMSKAGVPQPLFDSLEHMGSSLDEQIKRIQSRLPAGMSPSEVAADYQYTCQFLHRPLPSHQIWISTGRRSAH